MNFKNAANDKGKTVQILVPKELNQERNSILNDDLHINDKKILSLLSMDSNSQYSFTGIRRKLNVHQQTLTRALARLEELGFIEKSAAGYRLSKNAEIIESSTTNFTDPTSVFPNDEHLFQLIHARIPVRTRLESVLNGLQGKWFDKFRFIGSKILSNGYVLKWLNETDSFELIVRLVGNYCIIYTNAESDKFKLHALVGATRIVSEIAKLVQGKLEDVDVRIISDNKFSAVEQMN